MNDRFRFRAFIDGQMLYGNLSYVCEEIYVGGLRINSGYYLSNPNGSCHYAYIVDENKIMQCTGLRDKNGKLIYEGDIVNSNTRVNYEVEWKNCQFYLKTKSDVYAWKDGYYRINFMAHHEICEVIGNKYENPKLLGDK